MEVCSLLQRRETATPGLYHHRAPLLSPFIPVRRGGSPPCRPTSHTRAVRGCRHAPTSCAQGGEPAVRRHPQGLSPAQPVPADRP